MTQAVQYLNELAHSSVLQAVRANLRTDQIIDDTVAIQQIAAPTFAETARAAYLRDRFQSYPLQDIAMDDLNNVYARWPGTEPDRPALLVSAHLDTVFDTDTDLSISRHHAGRLHGPGIGDNSLGVAGLLALIDTLHKYHLRSKSDIWIVGNSREEGLGNLDGIRAVYDRLHNQLGAALVLEGMALGRIYHAGIAVRRLHITCQAPGGHSWTHFGQPSAIHGLVELGARITAIQPLTSPRTTYNIGLIQGGQSVNSIASEAEMYLDMRSESPNALEQLEQEVDRAIGEERRQDLTFSSAVVGERPAGYLDQDHVLVQMATAALEAISHKVVYESGSTDANVLLANGLPTITIGLSYGSHAHRLDEYIETGSIAQGTWHFILLALAAADQLPL